MHKGHTGFYTGPEGSVWFDFQKGVGWLCDYKGYQQALVGDYYTLWEITRAALDSTSLTLPEEYLK